MLPYFKTPHQVLFYDVDADHYQGGIAYDDEVICGCCGGIFPIAELYEYAPKGVEPIKVFKYWVDLTDDIVGDCTTDDAIADWDYGFTDISEFMDVDPNQLAMYDYTQPLDEENLPF